MKFIGKVRRSWAAITAALAAGCAAPVATPNNVASPSEVARPALWEVADDDTRVFLFGTIHLLPPGYRWRTAALDGAVATADLLVVETIIDTAQPQALAAELAAIGLGAGLPPLLERVAPAKRAALAAAIAKSGVPAPLFDRMESWAAAFTLIGVQMRGLGLNGEDGVETVLRKQFAAAAKPVAELETNRQQLAFFDNLPENAQRALLEGAIETPEATRGQFEAMLKSWSSGDTAAIARSFNQEFGKAPELLDALLYRRNANWARWIERRMARPGTVVVAVGAGHLAGDGSVQSLLEKGGYKVRRLQ